MDQLVLDLETQHEFSEVGGRDYPHLLKVSLVGVYSYARDAFLAFEEKDIPELEKLLSETNLIVGFNTKYFDYAVLQPYLKNLDLKKIPACDIMEDVANILGHRLSLESIAQATLGTGKSGHGLDAIRYFREGNMEALKKYCLDDVRITRDVFEYGKANGTIRYTSKYRSEPLSVPVNWKDLGVARDVVPETTPAAKSEQGNYSLF